MPAAGRDDRNLQLKKHELIVAWRCIGENDMAWR
jgi:hypothetical protein